MPDIREMRYTKPPKLKVLLHYIVYPLAMGTYFRRALQRRPDVDLKVCGQYTGSWIPWMGGMNLQEKYAIAPDVSVPFSPHVGKTAYNDIKTKLEGWTPDLIITVDAGVNWISKPQDGYVVTIGTDPHVLNYDHARQISDKFFCMQRRYKQPLDVYLPYAYDPFVHFKAYDSNFTMDDLIPVPKDTDCVLVGMPYPQRIQWVEELRARGVSVLFENSPVFDEYRELANRARIGLNWSSMDDLNARFFETPAFGLAMVTNRVPDAHLFLTEGIDYLGFDNLPEAIIKVMHLVKNPDEAERISRSAYQKIQPHTYDSRIQQLLEECGF